MRYFLNLTIILSISTTLLAKSNPVTSTHIQSVKAVTEVFGEGQKVTGVVLTFDQAVDGKSLQPGSFAVEGRPITRVYTSSNVQYKAPAAGSKTVIIELSAADANVGTFEQQGFHSSLKAAKVSVRQLLPVQTTGHQTYAPAAETLPNNGQINLIVDDFVQEAYQDAQTGKTIKYNLYVPKGYDAHKAYPMVLFIHDAGVLSADVKTTLVQGLGAVIWASPAEQAKHPAFVLAPQFDKDNPADASSTAVREAIVRLIASLQQQYSIDANRLYATGQSMGCMTEIALDIEHPHLFAASYLVAGQWDAAQTVPMAQSKLWIVVSQGDERAFPGMNAITDTLQHHGARISQATWNGRASAAEFNTDVQQILGQHTPIQYTPLQRGTVVWPGMADNGGSNHICTWRIAYTIEGVRDWLFAQRKS